MKVEPIGADALRGTNEAPKSGPRFTDKDRREELSRTINERNILYPGLIRQGRMTHAESEHRQGILQEMFVELDTRIRSGESQQAQQVSEETEAEQRAQVEPIEVTGAVEVGGIGAPAEERLPTGDTSQNVSVDRIGGIPEDKSHGERAG